MSVRQAKVVVMTGASSGLGRAAAVQFARRGCTVVLAARRPETLEKTARMFPGAGGTAVVVPTDVTREEDVGRLAERGYWAARSALRRVFRSDTRASRHGVTRWIGPPSPPPRAHAVQ